MEYDLNNIEHFAMPTRDIAGLERFVREILGGVPYYYAGYDEVDRQMGRKPHIFIRVGDVLFQCTEEGGTMHPDHADVCPAPHWAFSIRPDGFDAFLAHLNGNGVPFAGPLAQPQFSGRSIYFKTPEGHKLEVFAPDAAVPPGAVDPGSEAGIAWLALNNAWRPQHRAAPLANINPAIGIRDDDTTNRHGLLGLHHFALPVADASRVRRFFVELLDAEPAGLEQGGQGPVRFGSTCLQCIGATDTPLYPEEGNDNISPHWSFGTSTEGVDHYKAKLQRNGVPVAGPYRHRGVDLVSIYFKTPEGHKLEIGTWDGYPEQRSGMMGAPGVGFIPWRSMDHAWSPAKEIA